MALPAFDQKQQSLQCFLSATCDAKTAQHVCCDRLGDRLEMLCLNPMQAAEPFDYLDHIYEADRASKNLRAVRVRLEQHSNGNWDLVYLSGATHRADDLTTQRNVCRIPLEEDGRPLCKALGMRLDKTVRRIGTAYVSDDTVLTTISQYYQVKDDGSQELVSPDYHVEVTSMGPSTKKQEIAQNVLTFAGALYPIVLVQKLDVTA
eukprot:TRINITY_DN11813_c0_g1_i4.p2 TRINITY_DN11813_c0_g1~~TRINITY_DN11813_c0_g1_i4.p2  ORF type:complete len:205 (+),score=25.85 TRINITY_DN11813_c0_g1_i4:156-770(+)